MSAPLVILLVLAAALVWLFAGGKARGSSRHGSPDVDEETLERAERELQELDADVTPEAADEELDDWGPGAPK